METLDQILSLIGQYGYLIPFFGVMLKIGVMLKSVRVPIPGETVLIASGLLVQQGRLDLGEAVLFGTLGAMVGDQIYLPDGRRSLSSSAGEQVGTPDWITPEWKPPPGSDSFPRCSKRSYSRS